MSLQTVTLARTAVADALLTEKMVLMPWPLSRSTSKYGRSSVAAGLLEMGGGVCAFPGEAAARILPRARPRQTIALRMVT